MTQRRGTRVYLVGYYGVGNLGDETIRVAVEAEARALGSRVAAYTAWGDTALDEVRAVELRRHPIRHLRAIAAADRVVIGGGGLLKDEGRRMPLELLATAVVARLARRPVALLAVGVGPLRTRLGSLAVRATARLADPRLVRDADSAACLRSLGIGGARVTADPVFALAMPESASPRMTSGSDAGRDVIVAVRRWDAIPGGWGRLRDELATGLAGIADGDRYLRLVHLYWPRDRDVAVELARHINLGEAIAVDDGAVSWEDLVSACASARLVVAMRYHALVAAAVAGAPVVAIAYEPKVAALAAELGIPSVDPVEPGVGDRLVEAASAAAHDPGREERVAVLRARARLGIRAALGRDE